MRADAAEQAFIDVDSPRAFRLPMVAEANVDDRYEVRRVARTVYISAWRFPEGDHRFPMPIKVELELGDDGFIAFSPTVDSGGTGASPQAAFDDLLRSARGVWAELSGTPADDLHPSAVRALARLKKYFE